MIDAACNYLNPYATATFHAATMPTQVTSTNSATQGGSDYASSTPNSTLASLYSKSLTGMPTTSCNPTASSAAAMKLEMQYPPQASSTGSASPNSSIQSAPSSASVSPSIFPTPAQSFASISSSPPVSTTSSSPLMGSPATPAGGVTATGHPDLGAAAAASAAYSWNTYSAALPTRTQFPYAQYATDYYGNVGMSASAGAAWFSHQDSLYQPWSRQTYPSFNFDDIAFQTQLQRRSVRCTCPNCTNEMSGLPPIVGPDERGRKQHICHIPGCERLYGKASHLKTHLRWHTGERPFLCLTCGKRFSRSDELQRHGRTHTNYRPYACPICSKKFSRSDHLSKHKKTHFKDKKSKKAIAAEAKEQAGANTNTNSNANSGVKMEKAAETQDKTALSHNNNLNTTTNNNNIIKPIASTTGSIQSSLIAPAASTATSVKSTPGNRLPAQPHASQLHLKTEQPDIPSGYNPYTNLYHQGSSLFHHPHHLSTSSTAYSGIHQSSVATQQSAASLDLWHSHQQSRNAMLEQQNTNNNNSNISNISNNNSNNNSSATSQNLQSHNSHHQHNVGNNNAPTTVPNSQHYAALAMQSESQLAAEYGLTMSAASSGGTISPLNNMQHSAAASNAASAAAATHYSGLIGQMKSEYPGYPDFSAGSGYATTTSAFHHHPHNPWAAAAAYQHQHATA